MFSPFNQLGYDNVQEAVIAVSIALSKGPKDMILDPKGWRTYVPVRLACWRQLERNMGAMNHL